MPDAGEVILVEFPGVVATKRRPAVVLSSAEYHKIRPDLIVGLVTSQTGKATGPTDHLIVDWQAAGLPGVLGNATQELHRYDDR